MFKLPRAVWLLGWVSLATDAASEAIYPLLPFFLTTVLGAGAVSLGVVEGAAEAANSLLKVLSGRLADRTREKRRLVLLGYGVSSAARPFIAMATGWLHVFTVRVLDRVGKGIRGAPRDAMLAGWATSATRGRVYGFHQAMDNLGAVVGPALTTVFLLSFPGQYRRLFTLTVVPGAIAVLLILLIPRQEPADVAPRTAAAAVTPDGSDGFSRPFRRFMIVLAVFALGNSTDAFLLLRLTQAAGSPRFVPLMWAGLHVVKAAASFAGGSWSDRIGRRAVISIGWLIYAVVYAGFAVSRGLPALVAWFLVYGLYFGFAEGTERALVADLAPASRRGTAFGIYNGVIGLGALASSVLFGAVWTAFGAAAAFGVGAALALVATGLLLVTV
jgi:MFS family permease